MPRASCGDSGLAGYPGRLAARLLPRWLCYVFGAYELRLLKRPGKRQPLCAGVYERLVGQPLDGKILPKILDVFGKLARGLTSSDTWKAAMTPKRTTDSGVLRESRPQAAGLPGAFIQFPVDPSQLLDLALHLFKGRADLRLQARPPRVSEFTDEQPRFLEEQAHVAQLGELGFCHLEFRRPFHRVLLEAFESRGASASARRHILLAGQVVGLV